LLVICDYKLLLECPHYNHTVIDNHPHRSCNNSVLSSLCEHTYAITKLVSHVYFYCFISISQHLFYMKVRNYFVTFYIYRYHSQLFLYIDDYREECQNHRRRIQPLMVCIRHNTMFEQDYYMFRLEERPVSAPNAAGCWCEWRWLSTFTATATNDCYHTSGIHLHLQFIHIHNII
jgi:hypothetical protein